MRTVCIVPAYRAADSIASVVVGVLPYVDHVIVVDDASPDECGSIVAARFAGEPRVELVRHSENRGVGGAMKTGIRRALQLGFDIVVKVDADGQMDPHHIPALLRAFVEHPRVQLIKGNRFFDGSVVRLMPRLRLLGNSGLTLFVRAATGYWNSADPTNGYVAIRTKALRRVKLDALANRYFFEISLLGQLGIRRVEIADFDMEARYGSMPSSLSIRRVLLTFPFQLAGVLRDRLIWQYLIGDMNVGSLLTFIGIMLMTTGALLGAYLWREALVSGVATTPGSALIVMLPIVIGFQLLLSALLYDVQSSTRVVTLNQPEPAADHATIVAL